MATSVDTQAKPHKMRAAAILRRAKMSDAEIAVALGVNVRSLQRWRAEARDAEHNVRGQFAEFRAASRDVD